MSSELGPYAIHRIIYFLENNNRRSRQVKKRVPTKQHLREVNEKWNYVYTHHFLDNHPPPMGYLRSLGLALFLKEDLDIEAMRSVFGHGNPLMFKRDRPRPLVPAIVEAFRQLEEESSFLDVTLSNSFRNWTGDMALAAVWPQVYVDYVPSIDGPGSEANEEKPLEADNTQRTSGAHLASSLLDYDYAGFVVETFRIPSKHFNKQLVVELYFSLHWNEPWYPAPLRPAAAPEFDKSGLLVVTFRLDNLPSICTLSGTARISKSLLFHADFATDVYAFLDRAHVGTSLIANRALNELIVKLKNHLPVHHLMCEFDRHFDRREQHSGAYWMVLRHFRSDLPYSDMRQFKFPSMAGPVADCALIIRYLSNSHLFIFERPGCYPRFDVKMIAALVDRNVSVDTLRMRDGEDALSDYRSMDTVFKGGMRVATLELSMSEEKFASLVKTIDFFRTSTVQRLKTLKLQLENTCDESQEPRRWEIVPPSLWIAGIHLLHNSERFEVEYDSDRLLRPICLKLVELCEKFERGEVSELVQQFTFSALRYMALPFSDDNKTASGVKVADYEWDVYRFRSATTGNWLTACVGQSRSEHSRHSVVHIAKGEVYPYASIADD